VIHRTHINVVDVEQNSAVGPVRNCGEKYHSDIVEYR
jgi:hypothetical protein